MSKRKRDVNSRLQTAFRENIFLFIFGLIFASCSSIPFLFAGQIRTITCERVETPLINCTIKTEWLNVIDLDERSITGLQSADLTRSCDDDSCSYGIKLNTADGPVSMTGSVESGTSEQKTQIVEQINEFVRNREQRTFTAMQSDVGWVLLVGLILPLAGSMLVLTSLIGFVRTLLGYEKKETSRPQQEGKLTGCQTTFTVVTLLLTAGLTFAAFRYAGVSQETTCTTTGRSWSEGIWFNSHQLEVEAVLNDTKVSAVFYQLYDQDTEALTDETSLGQARPCWINPWFSGRVTFSSGERPAGHIFWALIGAALVIGGFSIGNALSIVINQPVPPGTHLSVRLVPEGGSIGSQIWFMALMTLALLGAIYALFNSAWYSLPSGEAAFWLPFVFMLLFILAAGVLGYFLAQYLYIIYTGSTTTLELSEQPLRRGQPARLYVSHKTGRMPVEHIEVKLCTERTTRTRVRNSRGESSYKYETDSLYDEIIHESGNLHLTPGTLWDQFVEFEPPDSAPATSPIGNYPEIRWWFAVRVVIPKAPDFTIEYGIKVQ